jgi:hypothetical protein
VRRRLIAVVTFLAGVYFFLEFFLPKDVILFKTWDFRFGMFHKEILDVVRVIFVMSFGLGIINIFRVYGSLIVRRRKGWPNAAALLIALVVTAVAGLWGNLGGNEAAERFYDKFLYAGLMNNLSSSMFSLLSFYMASAAYRSFRVKSFEAALMMTAALVMMLGQIPLGYFVHPALPASRTWMMAWVSTPAFRGIAFGAMIAGLAMAVRMWLSLEKTGGDR